MELVVGGRAFKRRGESFLASKSDKAWTEKRCTEALLGFDIPRIEGDVSAVGILQ
jgi:hypothetical protein